MKNPRVSVIMPVYNGQKYLKKSLKSIFNQTFKDFELIVINDGSSDKTEQYLNKVKDKRLRIIKNKKNLGITKSLNLGLKIAKGKYIARCDVDDLNAKERFEKQVNFLKLNKEYILVGSQARWIDKNNNKIKGFRVETDSNKFKYKLFIRNQFHHPSVMYVKSKVKMLGGYKEILNGAEDYDLWFKLLRNGKLANLDEELIFRKVHEDVVTRQKHYKIEFLAIIIRILNIPLLFTNSKSTL